MSRLILSVMMLSMPFWSVAQWMEIGPQLNGGMYGMEFINSDTGFVMMGYGQFRRTTDGGQSWDSIGTPFGSWLNDIHFINDQVGYAAGGFAFVFSNYYGDAILKTTDGGLTWDSIHGLFQYGDLIEIAEVNPDEFFFVGTPKNYKVTNGGATVEEWVIDSSFSDVRSISFVSDQIGFVGSVMYLGGGTYSAHILRTDDGGDSWNDLPNFTSVWNSSILKVHFVDSDRGFVIGQKGQYAYTMNGGQNWMTRVVDTNMYFSDIQFLDSQNGFLSASFDGKGFLFRTSDGGMNWTSTQIDTAFQPNYLSVPSYDRVYVGDWTRLFTDTIQADAPTNIGEPPTDQIAIFPNPASEFIRIRTAVAIEDQTKVNIYDMTGKLVIRKILPTSTSDHQIEIGHLSPGMYAYSIRADQKILGFGTLVKLE